MNEPKTITLTGERLEKARSLNQSAIESLLLLGEEVFKELGFETRADEIVEIRFKKASDPDAGGGGGGLPKLPGCHTWHDMHGGCAEYCDPPGTCAPCPAEPVA